MSSNRCIIHNTVTRVIIREKSTLSLGLLPCHLLEQNVVRELIPINSSVGVSINLHEEMCQLLVRHVGAERLDALEGLYELLLIKCT